MKSEIDIKDDLYRHLRDSPLARAVSGELSKRSLRPTASHTEDIIISVLSSDSSHEVATAIATVNIYVPDQRTETGEAEEHTARLRELCQIALEVLNRGYGRDYRYTLESQRIIPVEGKDEHCISHRLLYRSLNERGELSQDPELQGKE